MKIFKEFKSFAMRGNVVDMAVGIIIGAAFGKIVSSLVKDVIMPPIGLMLGGMNFTDLKLTLKSASVDASGKAVDAVALNYGVFVQTTIDFIIVAFAIFILVKGMNALKKKEETAPATAPEPSAQEKLLAEIRDLLKKE
jgi:large conductance mechanosensitive channel